MSENIPLKRLPLITFIPGARRRAWAIIEQIQYLSDIAADTLPYFMKDI